MLKFAKSRLDLLALHREMGATDTLEKLKSQATQAIAQCIQKVSVMSVEQAYEMIALLRDQPDVLAEAAVTKT